MIAKLRGLLDGFGADHAVIDVNGVGYLVSASTRTLSALGAIGEEVVLHTEMLVAEDSIRLVGFATAAERDWFRLLTSVQGVGARVALAILSALVGRRGPPRGGERRQRDDRPRPGRRPQARPAHRQRAEGQGRQHRARRRRPGRRPPAATRQDALSALANLGFRPAEAAAAVAKAEAEVGPDADA